MKKFKPFVAHAQCCDSILLLLRARAYVGCRCGKTSVDAGDGHYHRLNLHEGVPYPPFYYQKKKGDALMVRRKKR
jgi:hypothetical protein